MKKIAINQPYFFPYLGYFQLINAVDSFVFYDDVNFIKKGWINRNSILMNGESFTFTIPCSEVSQNKQINEISFVKNSNSIYKILQNLRLNYKNAPYFYEVYKMFSDVLSEEGVFKISDLAINSILRTCNYLEVVNTEFFRSSESFKKTKGLGRIERIAKICKLNNASVYINPNGGREIYNKEDFEEYNVELKFLKMNQISYKQFKYSFVPNLSILDVMMFNSPEEIRKMLLNFNLQ